MTHSLRAQTRPPTDPGIDMQARETGAVAAPSRRPPDDEPCKGWSWRASGRLASTPKRRLHDADCRAHHRIERAEEQSLAGGRTERRDGPYASTTGTERRALVRPTLLVTTTLRSCTMPSRRAILLRRKLRRAQRSAGRIGGFDSAE